MSTKDRQYVKVIFRKWPARNGGGIIALFPALPHDASGDLCVSYERVGQHGGASPDLVRFTRAATPAEYASLERELRSLGYDLHIAKRTTALMHQQRRDLARQVGEEKN